MMAAIPTKLGSEAVAGDSKDQHALILMFCSKIGGITGSARPDDALNRRLGAKTGLRDGVSVNKLVGGVLNGECRLIIVDRYT